MVVAPGSGEAALRVPDAMPWAPSWQGIVDALGAAIPDVLGVVLFGSRTWGGARPDSDHDVLVVVGGSGRLGSRRILRQQVSSTMHLAVDLHLATPAGLQLHALLDPYVAFILRVGIRVGDLAWPGDPLSRQGLQDALVCAGLDLEDATETLAAGGRPDTLRHSAKSLAVLAATAESRYTAQAYRELVRPLLGAPTAAEALARMEAVLAALRLRVAAMAGNAGDLALRAYVSSERVRRHEHTV